MSFDDYARYIAQKYRLAISIAVLKTKPENLSIEEHIEKLRENISKDDDKTNFDDLSINSNDFDIEETPKIDENLHEIDDIAEVNDEKLNQANINISILNTSGIDKRNANLRDKDDVTLDQRIETDQTVVKTGQDLGIDLNPDEDVRNVQNLDKINENGHQNVINDVQMIETQRLDDSITILEDFVDPGDLNLEQNNLVEVLDILRGIDDNVQAIEKTDKPDELSRHCNNSLLAEYNTIDVTKTQNFNEDNTLADLEYIRNTEGNLTLSLEHNYCLNHNDDTTYCNSMQDNNQTTAQAKLVDNPNIQNSNNNIHSQNDYEPVNNNTSLVEQEIQHITPELKIGMKHTASELNTKFDNMEQIMTELKKRFKDTVSVTRKENQNIENKQTNSNTIKTKKSHDYTQSPDKKKIKITQKVDTDLSTVCNTVEQCDNTYNDSHYDETQYSDVITIEDKYIHGKNKMRLQDNIEKRDFLNKQNKLTPTNNIITQNKPVCTDSSKDIPIKPQKMLEDISSLEDSQMDVEIPQENISKDLNKEAKAKIGEESRNMDNDIFSQEFFTGHSSINRSSEDKNETKHDNFQGLSQELFLTNFPMNSYQNENNIDAVPYNNQNQNNLFEESQLVTLTQFPTNNQNDFTPFSQEIQTFDYYDTQKPLRDNNYTITAINKSCTDFDNTFISVAGNERLRSFHETENETSKTISNSKNEIKIQHCTILDENSESIQAQSKNCTDFDTHKHHTKDINITKTNPIENVRADNTESCNDFDDHLEERDFQELVPFKIIEEMNKVKVFLSRKTLEVYSSDTGYKSDPSQSKNSIKLSQSPSWLNQSAHSLFNYIKECPLSDTTEEITNEISVVLGELIDKFHEEENYPNFLEELLDSVKTLLKLLYEERFEDNALSKKDELTERLLLLNKSMHIQKITIEKITNILEDLHDKLTNKQTAMEIENTDQAENICYIFHLLKILLLRHQKSVNLSQSTQDLSQNTQNLSHNTQNLSQNTQSLIQNSQEESILKKSYISVVWKKKWNPNFKNRSEEGTLENKCVVSACGAILNKLIVNCMDGYSLISYYALKCFNVMQNKL